MDRTSRAVCRRLPEDVRQHIRSHTALSTVVHCVEELVLNSLDAEATSIAIGVNLNTFRIKVDDNGSGISPSDLRIIGTRYTTSKCLRISDLQNPTFYGYRGEALANIIQLSSSIEIYTRQDSTVYARKLKSDSSSGVSEVSLAKKPTKGTTIVVNNFLSKAVVRQKRLDPVLELEEIKSRIETIALINPRVSFMLKDDQKNCKLFHVSSSVSTKDVFRQLFGCKYGMGGHKLLQITNQYDVFYIDAFLSTELSSSKSYQYFYVNKRCVGKCSASRLLNDKFSECLGVVNSSNNNNKLDGRGGSHHRGGGVDDIIYKVSNNRRGGLIDSNAQDDKKGYPVFIVNIQCPVEEYDVTFEPRKQLIEFKRYKILAEAIEALMSRTKAVLASEKKNYDGSNVVEQSKHDVDDLLNNKAAYVYDIGKSITTHAIRRAVHSKPINREIAPGVSKLFGKHNASLFQNFHSEKLKQPTLGKHFPLQKRQSVAVERFQSERKRAFTPDEEDSQSYKRHERFVEDEDEDRMSEKSSIETPGYVDHSRRYDEEEEEYRRRDERERKLVENLRREEKKRKSEVANRRFDERRRRRDQNDRREDVVERILTPGETPRHGQDRRFDEGRRRREQQNDRNTQDVLERILSPGPSFIPSPLPLPSSPPQPQQLEIESPEYDVYEVVANGLLKIKPVIITQPYLGKLQQRARELVASHEHALMMLELKEGKQFNLKPHRFEEQNSIDMNMLNTSVPLCPYFGDSEHVRARELVASLDHSFEMLDQLKEAKDLNPNPVRIEEQNLQNTIDMSTSVPLCPYFTEPEHTVWPDDNQNNSSQGQVATLPHNNSSHVFNIPSSQLFEEAKAAEISPHFWGGETPMECQIITDSTGQDWLETKDATNPNQFEYLKLNHHHQRTTCSANSPIKSNIRLKPNDISLLNLNKTKPSSSSGVSFYANEQLLHYKRQYQQNHQNESSNTLSKNGNLELLAASKSILSSTVKDLISESLEQANNNCKWRFPSELSAITATTNGEEEFENVEGDSSSYFKEKEPWEETLGSKQILLNNLNSAELKCCWSSSSGGGAAASNKDFVFRKEDLGNVHVIGQLDKKFIIGKMIVERDLEELNILVVFDQHAVHERIRLESQLQDLYEDDSDVQAPDGCKTKRIATVHVRPPIKLNFNETELRIIKNYKTELENIGIFTDEITHGSNFIILNKVPKCFAEKISNEAVSTRDQTISNLTYTLIQEQLNYILDTRQQHRGVPKTIFNLLCSQACHGAIKFGDALKIEVCHELVQSLQKCQLPFQCAHGRPSVAPIINL